MIYTIISMLTAISVEKVTFIVSDGYSLFQTFALLLLVLMFAFLGLRLPKENAGAKIKFCYVGFEILVLVFIAFLFEFKDDSVSVLLIVILLRSSVSLKRRALWSIVCGVFFIYVCFIVPPVLLFWSSQQAEMIKQLSIGGEKVVVLSDGSIEIRVDAGKVSNLFKTLRLEAFKAMIATIISFGIILAFVLILVRSLVSERLARRQLAKAYEQIYQHSLQIEDKAVLEERTRIARDIHDTLGHLLVAQHIQLENALLSIQTPAEQAPFLEESKKLGSKALYNLRQVVSILRSEPEETLDQIVDEIVGEFKRSSKIKTVFEAELPRLPSRKLQLAVKGILSEALTNVQKHSGATEVSILIKVLSISEQELLYIEIVDNGRGVDLENSSSGFGLQNMRERAENIGGWLEINGQKGCKVAASLPVEG